MIDIENSVIDKLTNALLAQYPTLNITTEYQVRPPSFPCVSIVQVDSYTNVRTTDSGSVENSVVVMYEINVYSNNVIKKKTECKEIITFINNIMIDLGFTRRLLNPIVNADNSIYRIIARYSAIVDKNETIYGR